MNDLGSPLQIFARNTLSLVLREMRSRYSEQKLSYAWALLEPLGWITMLSLMFMSLGTHNPPVGDSFVVFFCTGVVPFNIYSQTSGAVMNAIQMNKSLLYFPIIKSIDTFVSRAILEIVTHITVLVVIIGCYNFMFGGELPEDWLNVIAPIALLAVIGFNTGVINCVIVAHFKEWRNIWGVISRPLFFLSGIFYVVESFPPPSRISFTGTPSCIAWSGCEAATSGASTAISSIRSL
ncbi:ABC transporter permease [Breoghania sp. L-A4]|uniref:ABC transporter permease n=1 Tax=Breoghania sp. L-A4 TaxID=2304600 RepID=UPI000E35DC05|nr:ABC transporter permease [Breoghania sp. L-A4]AXS40571.1 hypothetical protein D1F64_11520 [Breoghania sp. L-A4]